MADETSHEWALQLLTALATLSSRHAAVLCAIYFDQSSEARICARMGLTPAELRRAAAEGLSKLGGLLASPADGIRPP